MTAQPTAQPAQLHPLVQQPGAPQSGPRVVGQDDVPANRRRGGDIRVLLSPSSVGARAGFLGTLTLEPGEVVTEHWHPYSDEFLYCVDGRVEVALDGVPVPVATQQGLHIPLGTRHRIDNCGDRTASFVFFLGPLAPRPELGHVDTEQLPGAGPRP